MNDEIDGKHGVQSLEIGMGLLRAMVDGQRAFVGSQNISTTSLDQNRELGIIEPEPSRE